MRHLLAITLIGCVSQSAEEASVVHMTFVPAVEPLQPAPQRVVVLATHMRIIQTTAVYAAPRRDADRLGVIERGTVVALQADAPGSDDCTQWFEIAPRGWTCASEVEETAEDLTRTDPDAPVRMGVYGIVRKDAEAFATTDDIATGSGTQLVGANSVRAVGAVTIDGHRYWRTSQGKLIDATQIIQVSPSKFHGVAIAEGAALPAWVRARRDPYKPAPLRDRPHGRIIGELAARTVVGVQEERDGFVKIDEGRWIARGDLRVASLAAPPAGTTNDDRWLDVDLDEQVLVAYEGSRAVYATLVSTGKREHETPPGISRIASKHETAHMTSDKQDVYSVADVPWTMYFDGNYALHTSYWHDGFGTPKSHGCINLAPEDARFLYHWSSPDVPPGWISVYGNADVPGSLVRIRSRDVADPPFRGYARTMHNAAN